MPPSAIITSAAPPISSAVTGRRSISGSAASAASTAAGTGPDGTGQVLVAVAPGQQAADGQAHPADPAGADPAGTGRVVGTIMLQVWPHTGQTVKGPGEAEIRALAVRPEVQGGGIGELLLRRVIERATETGVRHLVLCTEPGMRAAHRLYERAGFVRLRERDWSPAPVIHLLVYGLRLDQPDQPSYPRPHPPARTVRRTRPRRGRRR